MADVIDVTNLSTQVIEAKNINLPEAVGQQLGMVNDVVGNVADGQKVVDAEDLGMMGEASTGCGINDSDNTIVLKEQKIAYNLVTARVKQCAVNLRSYANLMNKNMGAYKMLKDEAFKKSTGMTNAGILLMDLATQQITPTIARVGWFGDSLAKTVTNGGVYDDTLGAKISLFQTIKDGLWKKYIAGVTAGDIAHVNIATNEEATKELQTTYTADWAYKILWAMYLAKPKELATEISKGTAMFYVTGDIFDNYLQYLENKSTNGGVTVTLEQGKRVLEFQGIKVFDMREYWDVYLKYQYNGTKYNDPNRAILTTARNQPIFEMPAEDNNSEISMFYDPKDKVNILDLSMLVDAKILNDKKAVVAY